jgi:hypothetical protein
MTIVNISNQVPWDLQLILDDTVYATLRPTLKDLAVLSDVEKRIAGPATQELERVLRDVVKRFFPPAVHPVIEATEYDDLLAAFTACSTYFSDWLKKKQQAAKSAAIPAAIPCPSARS